MSEIIQEAIYTSRQGYTTCALIDIKTRRSYIVCVDDLNGELITFEPHGSAVLYVQQLAKINK